jgi:hypothetical protein
LNVHVSVEDVQSSSIVTLPVETGPPVLHMCRLNDMASPDTSPVDLLAVFNIVKFGGTRVAVTVTVGVIVKVGVHRSVIGTVDTIVGEFI